MRAAGFQKVEILSREHNEIDEAAAWDQVQEIVSVADLEEARNLLAEAGLSPSELAHKVASIKVRAYKPA
jgi:hypothetical protein